MSACLGVVRFQSVTNGTSVSCTTVGPVRQEEGPLMTNRTTGTLLCFALLLTVAACGGGDDEPAAEAGTDTASATTTNPAEAVSETAEPSADEPTAEPSDTAAEPDTDAPSGDRSFIRVTIGDESWELEPGTSAVDTCAIRDFGGQLVVSLAFTSGASAKLQGNADGFDESSTIEIKPDVVNDRYVSWIASSSVILTGLEPGQSGIETLEIDENGASGTAVFVHDEDGTAGDVLPGTFEIACAAE
jgi:hypothetical protein